MGELGGPQLEVGQERRRESREGIEFEGKLTVMPCKGEKVYPFRTARDSGIEEESREGGEPSG